MIVVVAALTIDPDDAERFVTAARSATFAARAEIGCKWYVFSHSLDDPETFHIAEVWATTEAFENHVASPHHHAFKQALDSLGVRSRRIEKLDFPGNGGWGPDVASAK